jgi:hypothetical protein
MVFYCMSSTWTQCGNQHGRWLQTYSNSFPFLSPVPSAPLWDLLRLQAPELVARLPHFPLQKADGKADQLLGRGLRILSLLPPAAPASLA